MMAHARTFVLGFAALCLALLSAPAFSQDAPQGKDWDLVYIGRPGMAVAAQLFAERASTDLGVTVHVWQRTVTLLPFATQSLQSGAWSIVDGAKIVLVQGMPSFGRREGYCLDTIADTPYSQTSEALRVEVDAFLAELTRHVDPNTTMIRIALWPVPPGYKAVWAERDVVDDCVARWVALTAQWKEAAAQHGIPVVDLQGAWNGADGKGDAPAAYFEYERGFHRALSQKGAAAAVGVMHALGYAPLAP
jgi:hypothetical protein